MKKIPVVFAFLWMTFSFAQSISKLYEKANTSVVLIKTWQPEIFGKGQLKTMVSLEGIGSGFVVSEEGDIMTASHIVQTAALIRVVFSDGEEVPAKVLYSYPMADVALIRLTEQKSTPLSVVTMADSDKVKIGDQVFVIGSPFGLGHSLSVGYVSGKYSRKDVSSGFMTTEFIQTDASVNEGSSGGPLFNMNGEVIGIASFILSHSEGFQGISFAATSNIAQELLCEGHPIWVGIEAHFVSAPLAEIFNLPQSGGLLVEKVAPLSLGDKLGLRGGFYRMSIEGDELLAGGDILLMMENISLTNEENLIKAWGYVQRLKEGDSISAKIIREGEVMKVSARIPKR
ncbi:S1C family serine protease [Maribacter halichondriae]|uniref:S1C family serine protease n=1 Tax=Maribacter halichondriae TaxID=2980554 RepID=UPI002359FD19|nr:trypsin-like peptidase domain-containing protein [Maribacter sp. Hal144]